MQPQMVIVMPISLMMLIKPHLQMTLLEQFLELQIIKLNIIKTLVGRLLH